MTGRMWHLECIMAKLSECEQHVARQYEHIYKQYLRHSSEENSFCIARTYASIGHRIMKNIRQWSRAVVSNESCHQGHSTAFL